MTQVYSDPACANDPRALPDIEVFYLSEQMIGADILASHAAGIDPSWEQFAVGWYWWYAFPGCLPDGDLHGPFPTEAQAIQDVRENH